MFFGRRSEATVLAIESGIQDLPWSPQESGANHLVGHDLHRDEGRLRSAPVETNTCHLMCEEIEIGRGADQGRQHGSLAATVTAHPTDPLRQREASIALR